MLCFPVDETPITRRPLAAVLVAGVPGLVRAQAEGRTVPPFRYHDKGSLAVIGRAAGVADFGRLHFHGWPAWLLWLFVHLMYLAQFRNRLLVFIRWGFQYLSFDRGARLITGD